MRRRPGAKTSGCPISLEYDLRSPSFHPLALLLSIAVHLGAVFAFGRSAGNEAGSAIQKEQAVIVASFSAGADTPEFDNPIQIAAKKTDGKKNDEPESGASKGHAPIPPPNSANLRPTTAPAPPGKPALLPILPVTQPRYFLPGELTEKPSVLRDIPPEKMAVLPDAPPQPLIVQLLISDQGDIDEVIIEDSQLSGQVKQFVIDSFMNVKFRPGKLGGMPVRSRLRIEVSLKSAIPVTKTTVH